MIRSILHPKWLLFINTLPIALMAIIYYGNYQVIHTLLSNESLDLWFSFSVCLGILWLSHFGYTIYLIRKNKLLTPWYGAIALMLYITYVYLFYTNSDSIIPWGIPRWMMPEDISLYVGTFMMPTMAHALFMLVVSCNTLNKKRRPILDFGIALLVPLSAYLFFELILPLWQDIDRGQFGRHTLFILGVAGVVVFLFFLCRGVYLLSERKGGALEKYSWIWKIVLSLFFPILGLYINSTNGIFGDFTNPWFYTLAILNGIVTSLPNAGNSIYRFVLFIFRCITYSFIIYFFIVFLPYLPLSVVAIIAIGTGFLMLTPLLLMLVQTQQMSRDIQFLSNSFSKKTVYVSLFAGILLIPVAITFVYLKERNSLHTALDYIYSPDYSDTTQKVSGEQLEEMVTTIKSKKDRRWGNGHHIPYLSTYYNWLVLDNLTLSDDKINWLEKVYLGEHADTLLQRQPQLIEPSNRVSITDLVTSTQYDKKQNAWRSEIEMDITNSSQWQSEFATSFELPEGCWISNYYLWINNEKVNGLLAEKKTATWIYQQITSYRQDPGILYYLTGNKIALRVFPFEGLQTRKTGFQIIHKEPVRFKIDHRDVILEDSANRITSTDQVFRSGKGIYISADVKNKLQEVKRIPKYHFILDCSSDKKEMADSFISRIESYSNQHQINLDNAKIILANAYSIETEWKNLRSTLAKTKYEGGFFLERSIEKILVHQYEIPSNTCPIIIVVTDSMSTALLRKDFADLRLTFPESDFFYHLKSDRQLEPYSLLNPSVAANQNSIQLHTVVAWPDAVKPKAFLRINHQASILFEDNTVNPTTFEFKEKDWNTGLALQGDWLYHIFHPEKTDDDWLGLVQQSFKAQMMTPLTSFISLENEAQRQALLKKQKEVLNAKSSLDIGEETRMSEPGLFIILIVIIAFITRRSLIKRSPSHSSIYHLK